MAEQKTGPVVIDAATFSPAPGNTFVYRNREYHALNILQVRRSTRNRFAQLEAHLKGCDSIDEQADLLVEIIAEFVPGVPVKDLRDESWESLLDCAMRLGNAIGAPGDDRPTTGRKKSSSRSNTPK